jgi:hypothetical protein
MATPGRVPVLSRVLGAGVGLRDRVAWLIALGVFAAYLPISLSRYLQRDPASWDLGIFTEYVKQYSRLRAPIVDIRGAGFDLLGDHFHPIVALLAPFFAAFPHPGDPSGGAGAARRALRDSGLPGRRRTARTG